VDQQVEATAAYAAAFADVDVEEQKRLWEEYTAGDRKQDDRKPAAISVTQQQLQQPPAAPSVIRAHVPLVAHGGDDDPESNGSDEDDTKKAPTIDAGTGTGTQADPILVEKATMDNILTMDSGHEEDFIADSANEFDSEEEVSAAGTDAAAAATVPSTTQDQAPSPATFSSPFVGSKYIETDSDQRFCNRVDHFKDILREELSVSVSVPFMRPKYFTVRELQAKFLPVSLTESPDTKKFLSWLVLKFGCHPMNLGQNKAQGKELIEETIFDFMSAVSAFVMLCDEKTYSASKEVKLTLLKEVVQLGVEKLFEAAFKCLGKNNLWDLLNLSEWPSEDTVAIALLHWLPKKWCVFGNDVWNRISQYNP